MRERLLGLVTTPERAASIVGDAMEVPGSPGVGRMVVSIVWHDMVASRGRVAWLGLGAFLLEMMLYVLLVMSSRYAIENLAMHGPVGMLYTTFGIVAINFAIGVLLGSMARGREFAVIVARTIPVLVLLAMIVARRLWILAIFARSGAFDRLGVWLLTLALVSLAFTVPCFAGALLVRRRAGRIARVA